MAKKQSGLGKGLSSLLESNYETVIGAENVSRIKIYKIEPNKNQPRREFTQQNMEELADSIREHGVISPIAVRRIDGDRYRIIAGERRWRAAKMAGLDEVPAVVLEVSEREASELSLVENLQREDLNPVEEAEGIQSLIRDYGLTQEECAQRIGKSRPSVTNTLRLLTLPEDLLDVLREGRISSGHARALLPLEEDELKRRAADIVMKNALNVRQCEALVKKMLAGQPEEKQTPEADYAGDVAKRLSGSLGRKVRLRVSRGKGRIELEFYDMSDLDNLIGLLESAGGNSKETSPRRDS